MRTLAIGDIHGCFAALMALVEKVRIGPGDMLVTLGDYVDRGPDSRAVIEWLIRRHRTGKLIPLRGNHEIMMLQARDAGGAGEAMERWMDAGGRATLDSYAPYDAPGSLADVPEEHWDFLADALLSGHETATHLFVHAAAYPDLPLAEQPDYMLYWEQFDNPPPHESGKIVICGHTPQRSGVPKSIGHAICIDTRPASRGWLTCLDVATGHYWKANQAGSVESDWLDRD